ncbi:MAG: PLP-dependent transferase [Hyphomicrobiales bacterium]|nr:PLP-dependent transferase [Hyphomicrobiales bacterium]
MTELDPKDWSPETLAAQALGRECAATGAVVPPVQVATTFARDGDYEPRAGAIYGRDDAPNPRHAEDLLCALEGGAEALLFASGMAACTAPFSVLAQGDRVVVARDLYHGVLAWLAAFAPRRGITVERVAAGDPAALQAAVTAAPTALVWIETPSNPSWHVTDIAAAAAICRAAGARLCVDSTAATPVLTRPLALGAHLVCHSATKYLNGHSDVLAGALVTAETDGFWADLRTQRKLGGAVLGSLEAFLLLRGMRTLHLRVARQCANAMAVADFLAAHPAVEEVRYPGLATHPGHAVAARQMAGGFGGMLSFRTRGGRDAALRVATATRLWQPATSLGGVESLIEHRHTVEGGLTDTPDDLLRLSCGIEAADDLIADLGAALARAGEGG